MGSGRTLAVVVAHPDDDAFALSGTVALHADDPRFRFVLVHATDGGAGDIAPGFPATRETLGAIRLEEDRRAWRALGREPDRHEWLAYPDGRVADVPPAELAARVAAVLAEERPDVVATFGPDGITGHPDHVAVGAATDAAFHAVRADGGPGLRRLLHGAMPRSVFDRWNASRARQGLPTWDPEAVYHLRGVPDDDVDVVVDQRAVAHRVVAGLVEHRSQLHVLTAPGWTREASVRATGRDHARVVWPPRGPGAPVLGDVFEGLDGG